jgi:geranyl-CoA carboxylase beta subunit
VPVLQSRVDPTSPAFAANRQALLAMVARLRELEARAESASERKADRFAARGQLTPRERLRRLLDPGAPWLELGNLTGYLVDDDDPDRSVPGGGQLTGIGMVAGTRCTVVVNDSGISAGAQDLAAARSCAPRSWRSRTARRS